MLEGLTEPIFLGLEGLLHEGLLRGDLGIRLAHLGDQRRHHLPEEIATHAEHPAMPKRTTDDATEHVPASFIGRQDTIDDQEGTGTDMVGDDTQRLVREVGRAGQA